MERAYKAWEGGGKAEIKRMYSAESPLKSPWCFSRGTCVYVGHEDGCPQSLFGSQVTC